MSKYDALWRYLAAQDADELTLSFAEISEAAGVPLDHSFLRYKGELADYRWEVVKISMKNERVLFRKLREENNNIPQENDIPREENDR